MFPEPAILHPSAFTPFERGGGARTTALVSRKHGSTSLLNGITYFDPGGSIGLHFHNCEESVLILEGNAIAEIDGVQHRLEANDVTWIPVNVPHRFINVSGTSPMRIFWTYASIEATRTILATAQTHFIDAKHAGDR